MHDLPFNPRPLYLILSGLPEVLMILLAIFQGDGVWTELRKLTYLSTCCNRVPP